MVVSWLREIRNKNNLTQTELAKKAGISPQFYNFIENGHRRPSPNIAKQIANVLGFPNEWYRLLDREVV